MIRFALCAALGIAFAGGPARAECGSASADGAGALKLVRPVSAGWRLVGGFGFRRDPLLGIIRAHQGVDFAAPVGTPVIAAARGEIVEAKRNGGFGTYVLVRHREGVETEYAHLSRIASGIEPGACVSAGGVIGYVGSTGLSSRPHLHLGLLIEGRHVNPLRYIKGRSITEN